MISDVQSFKEYGIQVEKVGNEERCYVHCWEGKCLKKICVSSQTSDQKVPDAELLPMAQVVTCFEREQLPVSILGASPSLIGVLDDKRSDGRRFMMWQSFSEEVFLQCRLKGSLYEDWTEDKPLLRTCIRRGSVDFSDLRDVLSDVIELWPSIRPYVRYTGHPHFKSTVDRVSAQFVRFVSAWGLGFGFLLGRVMFPYYYIV